MHKNKQAAQKAWQAKNLAAIKQRLDWLRDQPDGIIFFEPSGVHFIVVIKDKSRLRLGLLEQANPRTNLTQSWLDLDDPLYLPAFYTQAAMLGLVWPDELKRACVIGFGGGRIPMLLHHYLPEVVVECADIDPLMVDAALKLFGLQIDDRLSVAIQDGREYLAQRNPNPPCDLIFVDVFLGNGYTPYRLATKEFYNLCLSHLSKEGALIVNILDSDPFYAEKMKTIQTVFEHICVCVTAGNSVIFAARGQSLAEAELINRAEALQEYHQFSFSLVNRAVQVKAGSTLSERVTNLDQAQIFIDGAPPISYFDYLPSFNTAFNTVAPNHPCPCGSGKIFEQCHGRKAATGRD